MSGQPSVSRHQPLAPVRWRNWSPGAGGWRLWAWLGPALLAALATGASTGSPRWGLVGAALVTAAMWRFFLPVEYELNGRGIARKVRGAQRHIPWEEIESAEPSAAGVWLVLRDGLAGGRRGVFLPFGNRRAEVLAALERYLQGPASPDSEHAFDLNVSPP